MGSSIYVLLEHVNYLWSDHRRPLSKCPNNQIDNNLDNQSKIMFALAGKAAEAVHLNYGPNYIKKLLSKKESSDFKERDYNFLIGFLKSEK